MWRQPQIKAGGGAVLCFEDCVVACTVYQKHVLLVQTERPHDSPRYLVMLQAAKAQALRCRHQLFGASLEI